MREQRKQLERKKRNLIKEIEGDYESMSDSEAQDYVNKLKAVEKNISQAGYENSSDELIAIVGAKRFLKLIKAEEDFRRKMLKEFRKRRDGKRKN